MDPQTQVDLSKLSDADKKELNQFLTQEAQKSNIQQSMLSPTQSTIPYWSARVRVCVCVCVLFANLKSCPPPLGCLLEEMRHREDLVGSVGARRGFVCAKLR